MGATAAIAGGDALGRPAKPRRRGQRHLVLLGPGTQSHRLHGLGGRGGPEARPAIYIAHRAQPDAPPKRLAEGTTRDWSPDGAKIAYVADDGLRVAVVDGGEDTLVAQGEIPRPHVAWAPDSARLAYGSGGKIIIAGLASPGPPSAIAEGYDPKWSPDGTQLAYNTRDAAGHEDLWAVPSGGSAPRATSAKAAPSPGPPTPPASPTTASSRRPARVSF